MGDSFKDTKEAVAGAVALAAVLIENLKDGVQAADFVAIMTKYQADAEFKAKIDAAVSDITKAKTANLSVGELVELMATLIAESPALIKAIEPKA